MEGYSYKMVATHCFTCLDTVRSHIKDIYAKLHVRSSVETVGKAVHEDLA